MLLENLEWNDEYRIGHDKVDDEHKYLFGIANDILNAGDDKDHIKELIKKLILYTRTHFLNEQNYMKSINYYDLEKHIEFHKQILNNLNNFLANIPNLQTNQIQEKLLEFVTTNIINHILVEDKKVHHFRRTREELRTIFRWKSIYEIGNNSIDLEHKKLFDIAIEAVNYNGKDILKHVKKTVIELYDYMKVHFANEEEFMRQVDYPFYEQHIKLHENIIGQMNLFIKEIPILAPEIVERKVIEYIDIWLVNHIVYEDQKISNWVKLNAQ